MPSTAAVLDVAGELDERDLALLVALVEHKVLATDQIHTLFFDSLRRCQGRLCELRKLGLLASLCNRAREGTRAPDLHYLSELGAAVVAFHLETPRSRLPSIPCSDAEAKHNLAHRQGVSGFVCALVEACEPTPGCGVHTWKPEHRVRAGGRDIQPDGFGRLLAPGGAVEFFLEYDCGTEGFWMLVEKLTGYLIVASTWPAAERGAFPAVAFVVTGPHRQAKLTRALSQAVERWDLQIALSARLPFYAATMRGLRHEGALGACWVDLLAPAPPVSMASLPGADASFYDLSECMGRRWRGRKKVPR